MANITQTEKLKFEKLLEMGSGYVLDFSNSSLQRFILDTINVDMYSDRYEVFGDSKANRLRAIWQLERDEQVGKLLSELLDYWRTKELMKGNSLSEGQNSIYLDCVSVNKRLCGLTTEEETKDSFLNKEFKTIPLSKLSLDSAVVTIIEHRITEIQICLEKRASLAAIIMCGSVLEGILLGTASANVRRFNESSVSPKNRNTNKVLPLQNWTLNNLIDVAHNIGLLGLDVKKYSHSLRDFRNYIHPYQQMSSSFNPDIDTAKISWQVLKAAITDLSK